MKNNLLLYSMKPDISPANILLQVTCDNKTKVFLSDLDSVTKFEAIQTRRPVYGTPDFAPPEVLKSAHVTSQIWMLGATICWLVGMNSTNVHDLPANLPKTSKLLKAMLILSPSDRPLARKLLDDASYWDGRLNDSDLDTARRRIGADQLLPSAVCRTPLDLDYKPFTGVAFDDMTAFLRARAAKKPAADSKPNPLPKAKFVVPKFGPASNPKTNTSSKNESLLVPALQDESEVVEPSAPKASRRGGKRSASSDSIVIGDDRPRRYPQRQASKSASSHNFPSAIALTDNRDAIAAEADFESEGDSENSIVGTDGSRKSVETFIKILQEREAQFVKELKWRQIYNDFINLFVSTLLNAEDGPIPTILELSKVPVEARSQLLRSFLIMAAARKPTDTGGGILKLERWGKRTSQLLALLQCLSEQDCWKFVIEVFQVKQQEEDEPDLE